MRGYVCRLDKVRRTPLEESLSDQPAFVRTSSLTVLPSTVWPVEPGHGRLHHPPHVFGRCGPGFLNRIDDGLLDRGRISRSRQDRFRGT